MACVTRIGQRPDKRPITCETAGRVPEAVCRAHIEKVASSVTFVRAGQLQRLLRWLGERSLGPVPSPPSEKEIAEAVLNRRDFEPQTDSLVRKEMSRLREKLTRYATAEGRRDEVAIKASGGYVLSFEWLTASGRAGTETCWLVLPFRTPGEMGGHGADVLEEVLMGLDGLEGERQAGLRLVSPGTAMAYAGRPGDPRNFASECRADFVVEGSLKRRNEGLEATVWLVDGKTGRSQRAGRVSGRDIGELGRLVALWLLEAPDQPECGALKSRSGEKANPAAPTTAEPRSPPGSPR